MRGLFLTLAVCFVVSPAMAFVLIDFEPTTYGVGPIAGQDGWTEIISGGTAGIINTDNGVTLGGEQCVELSNATGDIRIQKAVTDVVAAEGPYVLISYDVKCVTSRLESGELGGGNTLFRLRGYDSNDGYGNVYSAVGPMHYDGGGGPASQCYASSTPDGLTGNYGPGGPGWKNRDWHTVTWVLDYANREYVAVYFDGVGYGPWYQSPQQHWYFYDWNGASNGGIANSLDLLRLYNMVSYQADGTDIWRVDNIRIEGGIPEPGTMGLVGLGALALLGLRRKK